MSDGSMGDIRIVLVEDDAPTVRTLRWTNLFAQDEILLAPRLRATAGLRLEHNDYTGTELLPNLRLAWDASVHPYVDVVHEGEAGATTLALHLTGGTAELPLAGLPPGGRFRVRYSDGLNAVTRDRARGEERDRSR